MFEFVDRGRNILQQLCVPGEKIFFIGFNKCGTTSLHHLMTHCAIRSVHWDNGQLAARIEAHHRDKSALRSILARSTAYSDMTSLTNEKLIEGNRHFRLFHELFPDAYFILNDRDVEDWIRSRSTHRKGTFLSRTMSAWGMDAESVKDNWRRMHETHLAEVRTYFSDHSRFLYFRIDRDPIRHLIDFLSPSFILRESRWKRVNVSKRLPLQMPSI
jgi:hypothetical protein